jgi:hypothetical protein
MRSSAFDSSFGFVVNLRVGQSASGRFGRELRQLGQADNRFIGQATCGSRRHVVENDWQSARLRDGAEMRIEARLGRFVVVRHDGQDCVGAACFGVPAQFDGVGGRIRAGSRDHRYPTAGDADRDADEDAMFCRTQRGRFAGCAAHDQCGGA